MDVANGIPLESFAAVGLLAARALPLPWLIPAFGGQNIPAQMRLGVGFGLAVIALPGLPVLSPSLYTPSVLLMMLIREIGVGLTLGFVTGLIFRAAEMAGRLIDTTRGANMSEVIAPATGARSSPMGVLFLLLSVMVFFSIGGVTHIARALARSYDVVPVAVGTSALRLSEASSLAFVLWAVAGLLEAALGLAAPVIVAGLVADVVLGSIARLVPQVPVYFLGLPLKALAGVGLVLVSLGVLLGALEALFKGWPQLWDLVLGAWA